MRKRLMLTISSIISTLAFLTPQVTHGTDMEDKDKSNTSHKHMRLEDPKIGEHTVPDSIKDKEILISIVKEMADSLTGAQSTKHWAVDALWFDIPPFVSKGVQPAREMFDRVFGGFTSCKVEIIETETFLNGNMGIVCTLQNLNVVFKTGATKRLQVRETDCFEKRDQKWQLIHQHASVPMGGEWDGKIAKADDKTAKAAKE